MTTTEDIIDAEIVDTPTRPASTTLAVRGRAHLVATRIQPAVAATKTNWLSWLRSTVKFALTALTLDLWRGLCAWHRVWWRWKTLAAQTDRSMAGGKSAGVIEDRLQDRREKRTVQSLAGLVILTIGIGLFCWLAPVEYQQYAVAILVVLLFVSGHTWRPAVEDLDTDTRQPGYDGSINSVRDGLREAGVLKKPTKTVKGQNVWFIKPPQRVGGGTQLYLRLDKGVAWTSILDNIGKVGSALDFNSAFAVVEQIGNDSDAGLWMPDGDPFAEPVPWPLLDVDRWNAWEQAPFAVTPHGINLDMSLIGSNLLGGGKPGSGKTFSARPAVAPYILDPEVRIFVANGKGDPAWEALKGLSVKYIRGAEPEQVWEFLDIVEMMIEEMKQRYAAITESKVTEGSGFAPWLFAIDEVQEYLGSTEPTDMQARGKQKARLGLVIDDRLTTLARLARAAGLVIVMLTQRPDDSVMSLALRSMFGSRFANKVTTDHNSKMILGQSGPGKDASKLPGGSKYKGLGILVPDGEKVSIEGTPMCRPYYISDGDWRELGRRGYDLRKRSGTAGYLRGSAVDAYPLPSLLEQFLDHVGHLADEDRVSSTELREAYAETMSAKAFGGMLSDWGAPTGRAPDNRGPSGPLVGDLRRVAQKVREGHKIRVLRAA